MGTARLLSVVIITMALAAVSAAGMIATTAVGAPSSSSQPTPTLSMTAIDVGRGDAPLVTYPNGQHSSSTEARAMRHAPTSSPTSYSTRSPVSTPS
ncbi:MAG: hypothetical protein ACXVI5_06040 [Halobacteriota archaeon]